jgi:hypothetical protein
MKSETAYFEETAYHKCLFISTCDQNCLELKTQIWNAQICSIIQDMTKIYHRKPQKLKNMATSSMIS